MMKSPTSSAERMGRDCLGRPLRLLHRAISGIYNDALRGHDLRIAQLNVLVAVECLADQATPSALSRLLLLEKSSVSREVGRLVERGWMMQSTRADGRSQQLELTDQGRRLIDSALPSWEDAQARVRALLGEAGADQLLSMASRVKSAKSPTDRGAGSRS